jgi:glycosyltransferase involved in cell wall biosynthesis
MQNKRSILVVVESIDINDSSGTKGRVALIKNLKKIGHDVTVLHYNRKNLSLEGIKCIAIKENKFLFYILSRIRRLFNRYFKFDAFRWSEYVLGFSIEFFNDSNSISKSIKKYADNHDLILTLSKGVSFRTHHAMLKCKTYKSKWIAYVHDPYPFSKFPPPYTWNQPGYKVKEQFFKKVAQHAMHSIFPSQLLMEWMGQFYPNFLKTGIVIPHQNLKLESNLDTNLPDFFDSKCFNILHAGNLMKERPPNGLIEGYKLFLKKHPEGKKDTKLILIGSSPHHKEVLNMYKEEVASIHIEQKSVDFETVNTIQRNSSVNVILESDSEISPFLPGKFPHCVFANKPIIVLGPENSEVMRLMGKSYANHALVNDAKKISIIIEDLYSLWLKNNQNVKLNRPDLLDYLGIEHFKNQFENVF